MSAKRRPANSPFRPLPPPSGIKIVDQEEAEKAHFIICLRVADGDPTSPFLPVNRLGRCTKCNERVYFSATAPKKPPRLCLVCYNEGRGEADIPEGEDEENRMIVTQTTLDEVRDALLRDLMPPVPSLAPIGKRTIN